jgi:hypothetical protein
MYLAKKDGKVICYLNADKMMEHEGVAPEREITNEEYRAAAGLIRIIGGEIFLGKTDAEKAVEALQAEKADIDAQLKKLDNVYLTPRILAGIGRQDEYSVGEMAKHEQQAVPMRVRREAIEKELKGDEA